MAAEAPAALSPAARSVRVKARARQLGFAAVGITSLAPTPHAAALDRWLEAGYAGTMGYMHRQADRRKHPKKIVNRARNAVVVRHDYGGVPDEPRVGAGRVARYARGRDYHDTLPPALDQLAEFLRELGGPGTVARTFVDAGPVPERELAQRAGLGWIGKNTMLIDPARGSYTLLASVLTDVDLAPDPPFDADRCGTCTRCLDACPTAAFPEPRLLDATRCISYLTIEYRGAIRPDLAQRMGDWIFGCDVCQEVCPWNEKFAGSDVNSTPWLDPADGWIPLDGFTTLDVRAFDARYGRTPLARPGLEGMRRNAAIAAANASPAGRP